LSINQSICIYLYLFTCLLVHPSLKLFVSMFIHLCLSAHQSSYLSFLCPSVCLSVHKSNYLPISLFIHLSVLSVNPSSYLSLSLSIHLYICQSTCQYLCLFICPLIDGYLWHTFQEQDSFFPFPNCRNNLDKTLERITPENPLIDPLSDDRLRLRLKLPRLKLEVWPSTYLC